MIPPRTRQRPTGSWADMFPHCRLLSFPLSEISVKPKHSEMDMIHSPSFRVTGLVNATAPINHTRRSRAGIGRPGVVIQLPSRTSSGGMTQNNRTADAPDHGALIRVIAQHRDRAAFATVFGHFAPRIKAWMMRGGCDAAAAEELAQETMLAVWQKAALFDASRAGASTWIFTIARNLRVDALRRERHPSNLMPDPTEAPQPPTQADGKLAMEQDEARIRAALDQLPAEQAEVIRKAFFEDKAHVQIEKELDIPLGTVKSRLRLAMNRLRAALGELS
jgi:RNA polymerase sigma-70 factor (ECF subfamily)